MKTVYLTIDDCPSGDFVNKIDYLYSKKIPAILFCVGNLAEKRIEDIIYAIKKGFIIANHSYSHPKFSELSIEQAEAEILKMDTIIESLYQESGIKRPMKIFRFPYGDRGKEETRDEIQNILKKLGYRQPDFKGINYKVDDRLDPEKNIDVYWTYSSHDYTVMRYRQLGDRSPFGFSSPELVLEKMDASLSDDKNGLDSSDSNEIVLVHDHETTADLFILIINKLISKNPVFRLPDFHSASLGHAPLANNLSSEINAEAALQDIASSFPNLQIKTVERLAPGLDNSTFLVNKELIFRFPKHLKTKALIRLEALMLPLLREKITITLPDMKYINSKNGQPEFTVHRQVPGITLERKYALTNNGLPKTRIVKQLKEFIRQIRSFDINTAKVNGVPEMDLHSNYTEEQKRTVEILFPALNERYPDEEVNLKKRINRIYSEYFACKTNFQYTATLCHGDLKKEHILYDSQNDAISGIIDFGGLVITDPDFELWRPYFHYGRGFTEAILDNRHTTDYLSLFKKLDFYVAARMIRYAVKAVREGQELEPHMKVLREIVKNNPGRSACAGLDVFQRLKKLFPRFHYVSF